MGNTVKWIVFVVVVILAYKVNNFLFKLPPLPHLENVWWGKGIPEGEDKSIRPFKINVSDETLQDLRYRLKHAQPFTPPLEGIQQQYGMNTNLLKEIVDYWLNKYDWKKREKFLNQYPQFHTNIQGLDIHYIHVRPTKTDGLKVYPLLMLHGWPGSVREFYEIIPLLTNPRTGKDFVFEVIVAALPGYGFSDAAVKPGLGAAEQAVVFKNFMKRLGFTRFYAQGGDFGAIILQHLAVLFPETLLGFHNNMCTIHTPLSYVKTLLGLIYPTWFVRKDHVDRVYPLGEKFAHRLSETGYFHLQATKPDTLGVALKDSPVGLAAYILEKFTTGTNLTYQLRQDGGLKEVWGYEKLLDNVMIYWVTGSMPTAIRLYAETFNKKHIERGILRHPVQVPSACARFENDFYTADGLLEEVYPKLVHLSDYKGGHFAAFQLPEVLADDVFEAVAKMQ